MRNQHKLKAIALKKNHLHAAILSCSQEIDFSTASIFSCELGVRRLSYEFLHLQKKSHETKLFFSTLAVRKLPEIVHLLVPLDNKPEKSHKGESVVSTFATSPQCFHSFSVVVDDGVARYK